MDPHAWLGLHKNMAFRISTADIDTVYVYVYRCLVVDIQWAKGFSWSDGECLCRGPKAMSKALEPARALAEQWRLFDLLIELSRCGCRLCWILWSSMVRLGDESIVLQPHLWREESTTTS